MTEPEASKKQLSSHLQEHAVAAIPSLHSPEQIAHWNTLFTPIYASQQKARRYVDAYQMHELGVFEQIFNPQLQALIYGLIPDAVLFHCHAYEIDASQQQSHILGDNFCDGWHRDWDCLYNLSKSGVQQISLFVYLSDVNEDSGCFEINSKKLGYLPRTFKGSDFFQIKGNAGHTFFFNRVAYHRASPNRSAVPRRVLKISFQSRKLPNVKLALPQFANLRKVISAEQIFLRHLIGDDSVTASDLYRYIRELDRVIDIKPLQNPLLLDVKIDWLHEFRTYIRDLKYVFNLTRKKWG